MEISNTHTSLRENKKDTILFFPDPKLDGLTWHQMPFSVLAISSPLVDRGYRVKIFDERFEDNLEEEMLSALNDAICVGISTFTGGQISGALKMAKIIKQNFPHLLLVWGGWHPSLLPEQTAQDPNVDIVVYGQGELTFLELVEALINNESIRQIPGLCYKQDGQIIKTPSRPLEDINNFPPLPLNLINVRNYIGPHTGLDGAMTLSYMSSQGCPYRCGFCADKRVYQRRWFGLKPRRVVEDLNCLVKEYNLEAIYFEDNNFFVDKCRVEQICEGIIANRLNIKWEAMGHPRQLLRFDNNFWDLIRESGCRRILIGAESGDQEILNLIKKDTTLQDTVDFVKKAKRHNIVPILSTMTGFPMAPKEDLYKTVTLAVNLKKLYKETEFKLFLYTPYPGTDLYDMAIKCGMKQPDDLLEWSRHTLRDVKTPWLDDKFRARIRYIAFFYFQIAYPSKLIQRKVNQVRYKFIIKPIFKIVQFVARIRLASNFYSLPIEPLIYNYLRGKWLKFV